MAAILDELIVHLRGNAAVTTLCGSGADLRAYADAAKQTAQLPYIVVTEFEGESVEDLSGASGMASSRLQIDAFAATKTGAYQLAEAIRVGPPKLQGFRGKMNSTFVHAVNSGSTYRRGVDQPADGSDTRRYWASRDYVVTYSETVPV